MSNSKPTNPIRHAAPAAPTHNSRPTAGFDAQRSNAFQRELDRLSRIDRDGRDDDTAQSAQESSTSRLRLEDQKNAGGQQQFADDGEQRDDIQASLALTGFATARAGKIAALSPAAPELPHKHLNRIAAAIQELAAQGGNARYHLQLPASTATINGAVLGQDAAGRLTVQLIANAVLPPAAIQQLQQRLMEKLKDRNLRVSVIGSSDAKPDRRVENRDPQNQ